MSRKVAVFMPQRAELSSIAAVTDLLQLANRFACERTGVGAGVGTRDTAATVACRWLSLDGAAITLAAGGNLAADGDLESDAIYDAVFIASFESAAHEPALDTAAERSQKLANWLRHQHAGGATIAAAGNGIFLLAESGLLDGRLATLASWQQQQFHRRYPAVRLDTSRRLTESDRLLCAGSLAGLLPMALRLVQPLTSPHTAEWLAKTTLIDTGTEFEMPAAGSQQASASDDPLVAAAQYRLLQRYADKAQLGELAATLAVSPRTLSRRFHRALGMSPQDYVQTLRIDSAKRMLLRTSLRIDRVGQQVGYSDLGFFKRVFRSQTGLTPSAWRAQAQVRDGNDAEPR
jgi:transcriptional regulator GlxA family with amidase domain